MIISVQRQSFLASAILLSLVVTPSSSLTYGQSSDNTPSTTKRSVEAAAKPAAPNRNLTPVAQSTAASSDATTARSMLLKARQALAHGDVDSATKLLQSTKQLRTDFKTIGDSPDTVNSMIQRQNQLVEMASAQDSTYDASAASFLLLQAEALIYYRDFESAEMLIKQAKMFPVEFTPAIGNPDKLSALLKQGKQEAASQSLAGPKSQAMKLLSQAQLAMDQGRWSDASALVSQAQQLKVPDNQFAANEVRPWQLELKIQNAMNRQAFDPAVIRTSFEDQPVANTKSKLAKGKVIQADYDPNRDSTSNIQVAGTTDIDKSASRANLNMNRIPTNGLDFYHAGLKALTVNDEATAVVYFQKAWENREGLDGATRKQIKDQIERLVPAGSENILKATLASQETDLDIKNIKSDQRTEFSKLQSDLFKERSAAERLLETKPREALEKMTMVRGRIAQSKLDANSQRPLLAMIDRDINEMQKYIEQNLPDIMNDEANATNLDKVERKKQRKLDVEQQLQKLVDEYNQLISEERFAEAGVVVNQASDLDPGSELVTLLREKHRVHSNLDRALAIKAMRENRFVDALSAAERDAIPWAYDELIEMGDIEAYSKKAQRRLEAQRAKEYDSPAEARIWNTLKTERVQGEYRGTLSEAISQLAQQANVNIVFDEMAMAAEGIKKDRLVDVPITSPISLKSALEIILSNVGLVFVVESEVIKVTSKEARSSNLQTKTYYIGDLVVPMNQNPDPLRMNFQSPGMQGAGAGRSLEGGSFNVAGSQNGPNSQLAMAQQMGGNNAPGNPFSGFGGGGYGGGYGGGSNSGPQTGVPIYGRVGGEHFGGVTARDFTNLINLITTTIENDSWQANGTGTGMILAYPANLSLVVTQTQEIQDKIQDLLKKLRELNDVQIVIEVRFITLQDRFFERIGIDFDFNINDNSSLISGQNFPDTVPGRSAVVGRDPNDTNPVAPTANLDLQFLQGSFGAAQTAFGGFDPTTAGSFGFAILSDIEVFFLIQASKGDQRSSIMQAPTVTMFNGQSASVSDGSSRPFVTSVVPVVGDFAVAHQPIITILPDGTNLDVQAVVSDDRRFVRLNLVPFFSQVTDVQTFTFDGSTTTQRTTNSVLDDLLNAVNPSNPNNNLDELETVTQGITIQLPVLSFTTVNTVVSVPDGGTVLMGGIKRMSEGRAEAGIPFLSNIPYVNRLFRNTAIGHDTSNLMMMVTPRIIIQKEIEEDQVGLIGN